MLEQNEFIDLKDEELPQTEDIAIQTQRPSRTPKTPEAKVQQSPPPNQTPSSDNQDQQQYDKIDLATIIPKISNRQKLIQQNIKLKTQIYQLALQIDQITSKSKQGKEQKQEDPLLKSKRLQLKKHQIHLMQIRNKIFNVKHEIESYDVLGINSLENKIKDVRLQIKQNQEQKQSLQNISQGQTLAIGIEIPKEVQLKFNENKQRIRSLREKHKVIHSKLVQNERTIRKHHQQVVIKSAKIKDMEQKIAIKQKQKEKQKMGKRRSKSSSQRVSSRTILKLEEEIEVMEKEKKQSDKVWLNKIKIVESEIHTRRQEQEKKVLILKQKEKEFKLYQLKLKELNRFLKPVDIKKDAVDASQFKFKRNIRYIQK